MMYNLLNYISLQNYQLNYYKESKQPIYMAKRVMLHTIQVFLFYNLERQISTLNGMYIAVV